MLGRHRYEVGGGPGPGDVLVDSPHVPTLRRNPAGLGGVFVIGLRRDLTFLTSFPFKGPPCSAVGDNRLSGGQPGDRHPEWRAGDVVEPDAVEKVDRLRVTSMLTAHAQLQVGPGGPDSATASATS